MNEGPRASIPVSRFGRWPARLPKKLYEHGNFGVLLEFKPQDMWIGVYTNVYFIDHGFAIRNIWICIVPMLPIHIVYRAKAQKRNNRGREA